MNCGYCNTTSHIQIARIMNKAELILERAIFPGQSLVFEASPDAQLEIYSSEIASAVLADRIHCRGLQI